MDPKIYFFSEGCEYVLKNKENVEKCIIGILEEENSVFKEIVIVLVSDEYLLAINKQFLESSYYTDVITFKYDDEKKGEVYISIERVIENATKYNQSTENELNRIVVHGTLHLAGYNDVTDSEKETMKNNEDYYLEKYLS